MSMQSKKLWGGRFSGQTHPEVEQFTSSLEVDGRLWEADILGSIAHVRMLGAQGILKTEETELISIALAEIREGLRENTLSLPNDAEDIHSAIEILLASKLDTLAGKLHTARSRNDQVATACRIYLRSEIIDLQKEIRSLQSRLIAISQNHLETILPGLTHMQHAQPITLAHHLMAYFWMLQRDSERFEDTRKRTNELPLGAAALAGTSFPLDRDAVARELGFERICENSLDAVSDRDFALEFLSSAAQLMIHLSRLAEEFVLWSSPAFGYIELDDEVTTGSSIMPQKKNPDVAELIRGRVGRVTGALIGLMTTLKALPLAYNRDLQEDKVHLFSGLDTVRSSVRLMDLMLSKVSFQVENMANDVRGDFSNATDLADYLVRKGLPFRAAHEVVGKAVKMAYQQNIALERLSLEEFHLLHPLLDEEALAVLEPQSVVESRTSRGGTGSRAVLEQISKAKVILNGY